MPCPSTARRRTGWQRWVLPAGLFETARPSCLIFESAALLSTDFKPFHRHTRPLGEAKGSGSMGSEGVLVEVRTP